MSSGHSGEKFWVPSSPYYSLGFFFFLKKTLMQAYIPCGRWSCSRKQMQHWFNSAASSHWCRSNIKEPENIELKPSIMGLLHCTVHRALLKPVRILTIKREKTWVLKIVVQLTKIKQVNKESGCRVRPLASTPPTAQMSAAAFICNKWHYHIYQDTVSFMWCCKAILFTGAFNGVYVAGFLGGIGFYCYLMFLIMCQTILSHGARCDVLINK